jgi:hypothetical protein
MTSFDDKGVALPSAEIQLAEIKSPPVSRSRKAMTFSPEPRCSENQSQPVWVEASGCDDHSRSSQALPVTLAPARRVLGDDILWHDDIYAAVKGADAVAVLTEWDEYRCIDLAWMARLMAGRQLFDFRNLFSPRAATLQGLIYHGIGRPTSEPTVHQSSAVPGRGSARADVAASPL